MRIIALQLTSGVFVSRASARDMFSLGRSQLNAGVSQTTRIGHIRQ